jgi:hypothetical protein
VRPLHPLVAPIISTKLTPGKMKHTYLIHLLITLTICLVCPMGSARARARSTEAVGAESITITLVPDWITDGAQNAAEYGYDVAGAGDVNSDGYDDVVVGAAKYQLQVYKEGAAFVFYGSPQGLSAIPDWVVGSGFSGTRFGHAVSGAGDLNCDGYDDVVIGAPEHKNEAQTFKVGAVFVYYGGQYGLNHTPNWSYSSDVKDSQFGYAVGSAGDLNGDGCDDLIVGSRWYSNGQSNEGALYVFHGSPSGLDLTHTWKVEGEQASTLLGSAVGTAGDVNGDGYDDILAGAPGYESSQSEEGRVYVYHGSAAGLGDIADWTLDGEQMSAALGSAVGTAGDVNGDGYDDIVIGATHFDNLVGQVDEGTAMIYYGSADGLDKTNRWQVYGGQENSGFGISVSSAGDVDDDGYDDIIVGAHNYTNDQPYEGVAFLFRGGISGPSTTADWMAEGDKNDTWFGFSVAGAGHVNLDDFDDIIIGAPLYRRDEKVIMGRAFTYHGLESGQLDYVHLFLPFLGTRGSISSTSPD